MRIIHLSDLHIGKRVNEFSMIEDQTYILESIIRIVKDEAAECVIIAGDVYDKPVPAAEAVSLFDSFLTSLADMKVHVFVIYGNHDSPERLAFGAQLMKNRNIYMSPVYSGNIQSINLKDSYGDICFYLLPFIKPAIVRSVFPEEEILTYQDAVKCAVSHIKLDCSKRNILAAHQFVTGAGRCESEEILAGGIDNIDASVFDEFDYTALGHIHSPQHILRKEVRYCGTPLKYSFSEVNQEKSVTVLDIREKGSLTIRTVPLIPLRDMRKIKGKYMEVTSQSFYKDFNNEDYIHVTLTDEEDIPDGIQKLRIIYPNLMKLEYDNRRTRESQDIQGAKAVEKKSDDELFAEFFELQNNQPMSETQSGFINELIKEIQERGSV